MRKITARILGLAAILMFTVASADPKFMPCCFNPGNNPKMACCRKMAPVMNKCCNPHPNGLKHHMA
jgi:hypothetical protein